MRRKPEFYARAFLEVADETPAHKLELLVKFFLEIVRKNGDWSGLNKVLKAVQGMAVKRSGGRVVKIETARSMRGDVAENLKKHFKEEDSFEFSLNPDLLAGVRILIDEEKELDFSLNRKLKNLFKTS